MSNPLMENQQKSIDDAINALKTDKNSKIIEQVKSFQQESLDYSTMSELDVNYGVLCGWIKCTTEQVEVYDSSEVLKMNELLRIAECLYLAAQARIQFQVNHAVTMYRETNGIEALTNLISRNINEHGSGAGVVKQLLLSLYDGINYPFNVTSLRLLDDENFDDVISVLQMNARACPSRAIHKYFTNGDELWEHMMQEVKSKSKRNGKK